MPIIRRFLIAAVVVTLTGCGPETASQQNRSDVTDLAAAVRRYNASTVHNLSQQASVCKSAQTQAQGIPPLNTSQAGTTRRQATLINRARADVITGFGDCAKAANQLNYPLMVEAEAKITSANSLLVAARTKT